MKTVIVEKKVQSKYNKKYLLITIKTYLNYENICIHMYMTIKK